MTADRLTFFVNGIKVVENSPDPEVSLLTYLRNKLHLTGSKLGCGEGGCGACTVMVSKWDRLNQEIRHIAVNACLAPVVSVHESAVTTIEGIGSTRTKIHKVQQRLAEYHGSQCGFCTPGIVMSMYTLLRNKKAPSSDDMITCLQGNLCRCTGYRPIIAAFQTFTCQRGDKCCKYKSDVENTTQSEKSADFCLPYDSSQEPIFPPELTNLESPRSLTFIGESVTWHQPSSFQDLLTLKSEHPRAKIVVGNSEIEIEMNIKGRAYKHLISPSYVSELKQISIDDEGVTIGAACSLTDLEQLCKNLCSSGKSTYKHQVFESILEILDLFAGVQVRNVACIGGNIMTASPISDLNPIFVSCGVRLTFDSSERGERIITMDQSFFVSYRKTKSTDDEVLKCIWIPFLTEDDVMCAYKQSKRRDDDIAIVNAAMKVTFNGESDTVANLSMAFGGMDAVTKVPVKSMEKARGCKWNVEFLHSMCESLNNEMQLDLGAPGGMIEYRRALVGSFFFKFYHRVFISLVDRNVVQENNVKQSRKIISDLPSQKSDFSSSQTWAEKTSMQHTNDTVGKPLQHVAAMKQSTGEVEYIDDIRRYEGELHLALVTSTKAHAKIVSIDLESAKLSPGFVDFVDVNDIPGNNIIYEDEDVFADGKVTCIGHVIGAVVADTHDHAVKAARKVKVHYEDLVPVIITIEDAIQRESFFDKRKLVKGFGVKGFDGCDEILTGEMRIGGQEHFYMEPQSCIAIPRNGENEMEILCSCQDPTELQTMASKCLGMPMQRIIARTKRMGGGFGGKETKFCKITNPAVIAAKKLGKPVRCVLTRQDDMVITGGRHPFLARYKIGFMKNGKLDTLEMNMFNNGGNTLDLSAGVMTKALFQCDNSYRILNAELTGISCKTNIVSNTAFRGFGTPQSTLIAEDWIDRVAEHLGLDPEKVREINMIQNGDVLMHGKCAESLHVRRCWDEVIKKSKFYQKRQEFREFNRINRWKKRGIACVPAKFLVGYEQTFLNQAGALVLVYKDGSVLLWHGGAEMGQGLHTKMIQIASKVLEIPVDMIHVCETSTGTVPNTIATAGSVSSDMNGMAVKYACEKIMARLAPLRKSNPSLNWKELASLAFMERINLSATGHYETPNVNFEWDTERGVVYGTWSAYQTCGAAVVEVEIDVLSGHHQLMSAEIVMDVGNSLNPTVDIGQIEGAFVQGYGWVTIEEPLHSPSGQLLTVGPGAYKIPSFADTPKKFNVHLLKDSTNDKAVYSSKAVGEPPLLLCSSVYCALKDAIKSARADVGLKGYFRLDSPVTAERIRMACVDEFTKMGKVAERNDGDALPWSIRT